MTISRVAGTPPVPMQINYSILMVLKERSIDPASVTIQVSECRGVFKAKVLDFRRKELATFKIKEN